MRKFAVVPDNGTAPAGVASYDATSDTVSKRNAEIVAAKTEMPEPFNPIHQSSPDTLARIAQGEDPFTKERAAQTDLFNMILEYGALQKRLKEVESMMQRAAVDLNNVRGQSGGVPTIDKMHTILRFLPEIPKKD